MQNSKSGLQFCSRACKDKAQRIDGLKEIHNPSIDQIIPGMMIRYGKGKKTKGIIVKEIDTKNNLVLVGSSICGTLEHWDWISINQVKVVWSIGKSFDQAIAHIRQFDAAIRDQFARTLLPTKRSIH